MKSHPEILHSRPDALPAVDIVMPETLTPAAEPFRYKLLTGHRTTNGTVKSSEQLRTEYVQRTDELIRQMTEGVDVFDPVSKETIRRVPDDVVFLDKSARPVAWLTRELWPKLAAQADGMVPEMPNMHFLNIDREQWVNTVDPEGVGTVDIQKVDPSIIRSLRSVFVGPQDKAGGITPGIDNAPASLDGDTVLIVDEVRASGRTLDIAEKFIKKAFPTAEVVGTHWMGGASMKGNAQGNADLPVWYKADTHLGRGVGNRQETVSQMSTNQTQKLGSWFLSTRLPEQDEASTQLRKEIKHLAHDKEVLVIPSFKRDDDFVDRAERLNGVPFKKFLQMKHQLKES